MIACLFEIIFNYIFRNKHTVNTMRPRSGKEYQNIDRSIVLVQPTNHCKSVSPVSSISSTNINYVNITPVPESSESPSPGYQSSSSLQEEFPLIKVRKSILTNIFSLKLTLLIYVSGGLSHTRLP